MKINSAKQVFILNSQVMGKIKKNKDMSYCRKCNVELKIGDEIFTNHHHVITQRYHKKCAERCNII